MSKKKQDLSGKSAALKKWADNATLHENKDRGGLELHFNEDPHPELQSKLRAMGFRQGKWKLMWYADNISGNRSFAESVATSLPLSISGPDLHLAPTYDALKANIEKKDFSLVIINLKDGDTRRFVVFEPSKPRAEVIATNYARQSFGERFQVIEVKPRMQIREARVLFDEGKIITSTEMEVKSTDMNLKENLRTNEEATGKIHVKEILLTPQASSRQPDFSKGENFDNWSDADQYAKSLIGKYPDAYFKITWQDESTHEGWVDLEPSDFFDGKLNPLSDHVRSYFNALSEATPCVLYSKKDIERARELVINYQLDHTNESVENEFSPSKAKFQMNEVDLKAKPSENADMTWVFKKAYEQLTALIPNLVAHLEKGVESGELNVKVENGKNRKVHYFFAGKRATDYELHLSEFFDNDNELQTDIIIHPEQKTAEVSSEWLSTSYAEKYDRLKNEDELEDEGLTVEEDMTRGLTEWLDGLLELGYVIDLGHDVTSKSENTSQSDVTFDANVMAKFIGENNYLSANWSTGYPKDILTQIIFSEEQNTILHAFFNIYVMEDSVMKLKYKNLYDKLKPKAIEKFSNPSQKTKHSEETSLKGVFKKAYEQINMLIPKLNDHLGKNSERETAELNIIAEDQSRKIRFFLEKERDDYKIHLIDYRHEERELQYDIVLRLGQKTAEVASEWLSDDYADQYNRVKTEKQLRIENLTIAEDMTRALTEWLDELLQLGYVIKLENNRIKKDDNEKEDPLTNNHGVFTKETAGDNLEEIVIPIPEAAKYRAAIRIVKTSKEDYVKSISCDKLFGDYNGYSSAPSILDKRFKTRHEALTAAAEEVYQFIQKRINEKDDILKNEDSKNKHLARALKAVVKFGNENGIVLVSINNKSDSDKTTSFIKGLEDAYWLEGDNKNPIDKAMIKGIEFHQSRLRQVLEKRLQHLPIATLEPVKDELSHRFQERRSLDSYEKVIANEGKNGDKRRAIIISQYVDDMIIDNDLNERSDHPVMTFLIELLFDENQKLVDMPHHSTTSFPAKSKKQSQHQLNQEIEALIDKKDKEGSTFNEEEKLLIQTYTGSGGLIKQGASGRGILYEYYTPDDLVKKAWALAKENGYDGGKVLEPAVGTGNFIKYAPDSSVVFGFETNHYSARIAQALFPKALIFEKAFETHFFAGNTHLKDDFNHDLYSLVIGNPPYGEFTGRYAGMGEKRWTGAGAYDQYFVLRGLDLLKKNGLLIFVLPHSFLNSSTSKIKHKIAAKSIFIDSYRYPNGKFQTTDIGVDILVLKRK